MPLVPYNTIDCATALAFLIMASHKRRGGNDHVFGHRPRKKKLILKALNIVHKVEFNENGKA